jgi:hypothetical protein
MPDLPDPVSGFFASGNSEPQQQQQQQQQQPEHG